ncbi:MAG: type VI secretion system tip protein TssI/VgrG [Myxococcota bacterium]
MAAPNLTLQLGDTEALDVASFIVRERLSEPYRVDVTVYTADSSLPLEALVGKEAVFEIAGFRRWEGVCALIELVAVASDGLATYQVRVVPPLWTLTQRRDFRVFQGQTEVEAATAMLDEAAISYAAQTNRDQLLPREYRAQYDETDYAFVARMLEEAGVTFFFDFSDGTQLTLTDAPHERDATHELMFTDELVAGDPRGVAMGVTLRRQTRPGAYAVGDWDFLRGHAQQPRFDADDGLEHETQNERFHYLPGALRYEVGPPEGTPVADARGAMRVHERTGNELVARRLAAVRADAMTCAFSTNDHAVAPGSLVQILDHPHELLGGDRRFLVVTSRLEGRANETWRHVCEACDASVPYRPPLTVPRPRTRGLMTATVTGPAGEEIYPDEHGRVLVKFHWDRRGALDETSSYWVHVSQAWAGAGYGMLNLPRIGQEVLIDFLHGDPDQPLVVGRVHTGVQTPPYPLPEKKALSVWKSCSTPGGDGFNEITLDDTAGAERIYMHAQFDKIVEVEHDTKEQVKRDSLGP